MADQEKWEVLSRKGVIHIARVYAGRKWNYMVKNF
jgi:hypothetical protein